MKKNCNRERSLAKDFVSFPGTNGLVLATLLIGVNILLLERIFTLCGVLWGTEVISCFLWIEGDLQDLVSQPWRMVTYLFVHGDIGHLVVNMLVFIFFGHSFEKMLGYKRLVELYFLGGIIAGVSYPLWVFVARIADFYLFGLPLLGASGAIIAVVVANFCYAPCQRMNFFGYKLPSFWITSLVLLWGLLFASPWDNAGGFFAHLGGFITGISYVMWLRISRRKNLFIGKNGRQCREDDRQIEPIVDKIKRSGYSSLSAEERRILFHRSERK